MSSELPSYRNPPNMNDRYSTRRLEPIHKIKPIRSELNTPSKVKYPRRNTPKLPPIPESSLLKLESIKIPVQNLGSPKKSRPDLYRHELKKHGKKLENLVESAKLKCDYLKNKLYKQINIVTDAYNSNRTSHITDDNYIDTLRQYERSFSIFNDLKNNYENNCIRQDEEQLYDDNAKSYYYYNPITNTANWLPTKKEFQFEGPIPGWANVKRGGRKTKRTKTRNKRTKTRNKRHTK